ncbi:MULTISPECIES: GAF domain-containing sensor histidine kinase [Halomonadaceae]|uniref:GAF domain-containing sensor histidine kinase n=1 Tax=Halomonadaceae TaxID=28256 RepID=UPI0018E3D2FE|nr:GAF domain-containing sensor histidine kinase [Halomonas sp. MES3-P3E]|tara:strand:+ start:17406 stop:19169 length:1764 start_codon:yes stop_codon:yes gene_type:complete
MLLSNPRGLKIVESEQARLEALHSLAILDTPPEERFDRITRLATYLFGVDIALVSLVDEQRQWFKSRQGLALTQTCRQESFCAHAIQGEGIFEIEDASKDSRFTDNPLVTVSRGIRFYAGVPLNTSSGFRVGTLCIIDTSPRRLDDAQRQALIDLAACAEEEMNRSGLESELSRMRETRSRLAEDEKHQRLLVAALSSLNEISTSSDLSFAEQLQALLALGCRYLQMQIGIVSRIENDLFKVVSILAPQDVTLNAGQCLPLANTYCDMALTAGGFLAIHNAGQEPAQHHPCYTTFGLEAYIGNVVYVDQQLFGTVSFSSLIPRGAAFAETDKLFLKLLSRWIGASLERQRVDTLKNEFVSTISHELRTPLTAVSGGIKLVLGGATGELTDKTQQMLAMALKSSERLGMLINDLLDMEKLLAGQFSFVFQPHLLSALLTTSLQENQPYAIQYGVSLKLLPLPADRLIKIDALRFQQIMTNLLSNAAKFSMPGDEIVIYCDVCDESTRINVKDVGCGVPNEFRSRIFQKFSQADASDCRVKGGTGLGLSISKALTEKMGGDIGFTSREGEGSTFHVTFPWVKEENREIF